MGEILKVCNICNVEIHGPYCHQCGQQITNKKLTFKSILNDFVSNLFNLERSGFATSLTLLKEPKKVVSSYWSGNRKYYASPSKFILYLIIVLGIHIARSNNTILGIGFGNTPKAIIIVLPLLLILASFITFTKLKKSIWEHSISILYLYSLWLIISIIVYEILYSFINQAVLDSFEVPLLLTFASFLFTFIWNSRIFSTDKNVVIKSIGNTALQFILFITIVVITITTLLFISNDLEFTFK
ncbi:hypothetical protein [Crocinitomix catalasitica]|uniref:hypothetical protein n=1 Tax=Crocinitomix catalasitica TaxID=184607 RepID=UPI000487C015|nr:hypothetical protein [Crocinitomix catalasitica]